MEVDADQTDQYGILDAVSIDDDVVKVNGSCKIGCGYLDP